MVSAADLALAYLSQGKFAESEPLAHEAQAVQSQEAAGRLATIPGRKPAGREPGRTEGRTERQQSLLVDGYQGMLSRKDRIAVSDRYHLERARGWLIQLHKASGKAEKAAERRKE